MKQEVGLNVTSFISSLINANLAGASDPLYSQATQGRLAAASRVLAMVHIRFNDDLEPLATPSSELHTERMRPSGAQPSALAQPQQLAPAVTVRADSENKQDCYVLNLACSPSNSLVAAALSNKGIKLYAVGASSIEYVSELKGHTGNISELKFPLSDAQQALFSSSEDGTLRGWDTRSGQEVESYRAQGQQLHSFDIGGNLVAGGASGSVVFWDRRTRQQCAAFDDTHEQDVTQVRFHDERPGVFLSASEDGLVSVFDVIGALDEDEGWQAALNVDDSVASIGFYGRQGDKLWCRSFTEGLYFWDWAAACNEDCEGGEGPLATIPDARQQLSQAASGSPSLAGGLDYLIDCRYDVTTDRLWLLAGTSSGSVGFFPMEVSPGCCRFSNPAAVSEGGHTSVVRSIVWPDLSRPDCITGGEDARVVLWAPGGGLQLPGSTLRPTGIRKLKGTGKRSRTTSLH